MMGKKFRSQLLLARAGFLLHYPSRVRGGLAFYV